MSNNKQSSVEYLMDKLFDPSSMVEEQLESFEKAKAMHKEEIMEAHFEGQCDETEGYPLEIARKFYNETFGGNK